MGVEMGWFKVLQSLKWKAIVPVATRLGVPRGRVEYLALPRWLERRVLPTAPPNAHLSRPRERSLEFESVRLPGDRTIELWLHEKLTEREAMRQLAGASPKQLIGQTPEKAVRVRFHHPATEGTELLVPWISDEPARAKGAILKVASVRVEETGEEKRYNPDFLRELGLAYSRHVDWYQYARSATAGSICFHLNSVPLDLEVEAYVLAWEAEDFLTDLSQVRLFRHPPRRPAISPFANSPFRKVGRGRPLSRLRVAAIADPMTASALRGATDATFLSRHAFDKDIELASPDMIFVESAWRGNNDQWRYAIGHYGGGSQVDLFRMVHAARNAEVPAVFWNKEDPIHFDKFASAASYFEHVVTTDADCVGRYRDVFPETKFGVLPFFILPDLHNPFARHVPQPGVCFAGSFYGDRHPERSSTQEAMLDAFRDHGLEIYDRNHHQPGSPYVYPERFESFILGGVPHEEMPSIYKSYKWFLNVNTVTDSPTMYARRVPELLACGTGVITNPSTGIRKAFQCGVREWTPETSEAVLESLDAPESALERLAGALDVVYHHSFEGRMAEIATEVTGRAHTTGWREFVLVLTGSNQWLDSDECRRQIESLAIAGVVPDLLVILGREQRLPGKLEAVEQASEAPMTYIPLEGVSALRELAERDTRMVVAAEGMSFTPSDLKSLLCMARVYPAMVTGLTATAPERMTELAATCHKAQAGELQGPWLFRSKEMAQTVHLLEDEVALDRPLHAADWGLTWATAPRIGREAQGLEQAQCG